MELGAPELLIILVIILLIFGVGRISKIGGELGQGLKEFRRGLKADEEPSETKPLSPTEAVSPPAEDQKTASN